MGEDRHAFAGAEKGAGVAPRGAEIALSEWSIGKGHDGAAGWPERGNGDGVITFTGFR